MRAPPRTPAAVLVLITAAGAALRLHGLGGGLWFDEIWLDVDLVRLPFSELLTTYGSDNNHPLYTWSAWLCVHLFGESAAALRLPAFVFGTAAIPALWFLGRRVVTRNEALTACALLAGSYHGVWFSQSARGYAPLLFFSIVSTTALLATMSGGRRSWIGWSVTLALATWTHQTAVFLAAAQYAVAAFAAPREARGPLARGMLLAPVISLALHAPILRDMISFLRPGEGHELVESQWTSPLWMIREAAAGFGVPAAAAVTAAALGAAFLLVGAWSLARRDPRIPVLFLSPCVLGAATMIAMQRNLWPRFFFFAAGFLLLTVVRSATVCIPHGVARKALAAVVILVTCVHGWTAGTLPKQDFEGARAWVRENAGEPRRVATVGMASFVYRKYLVEPWRSATTPEELGDAKYVVSTMPGYLESRQPALAGHLAEHATEVARFRGSVSGGDVVIYALR